MSWLDPLEPDDALARLLSDWRGELDDQVTTAMSTELPSLPGRPRRWVRAHQRTAAATAIVVAIAGSTSVAAAASGPSGPLGGLHKWLYGAPVDHPAVDHIAVRVTALLDAVETRVRAAREVGEISASARARLTSKLDEAQALLDGDEQAPGQLHTRLAQVRGVLAAIPARTPPTTVTPQPAHGGDDTKGDGSSGGDAQGDEDRPSSDDGQDGHDGQGSDGGQTSDDGQINDRQGSSDDDGSGDQSAGEQSTGTSSGDGDGDGGTSSEEPSQESGHSGDSSTTVGTDESGDGGGGGGSGEG